MLYIFGAWDTNTLSTLFGFSVRSACSPVLVTYGGLIFWTVIRNLSETPRIIEPNHRGAVETQATAKPQTRTNLKEMPQPASHETHMLVEPLVEPGLARVQVTSAASDSKSGG